MGEGDGEIDENFIEEIKSVRMMIAGLNSNNKKIQTIKNNYAKAIKAAQERQNSDEMGNILNENSDYQKRIREGLINIAAAVKEAEETKPVKYRPFRTSRKRE